MKKSPISILKPLIKVKKNEGPQGANWGIWNKNGILKECAEKVFLEETVANNWTRALFVGDPNQDPKIELTYISEIGNGECLRGTALNLIPKYYRIAVYIKVGSKWWTKPYWNRKITGIGYDRNWACDIVTGGHDSSVNAIAIYLIPVFYNPLSLGESKILLEVLETNSLDSKIVFR